MKKCLAILILSVGPFLCKGQLPVTNERLYSTPSHDATFAGASVNGSLYFTVGRFSGYLQGANLGTTLYKCDLNLNKQDSIIFPGFLPQNQSVINHMESIGDTLLGVLVQNNASAPRGGGLLILDTLLNLRQYFHLDFGQDTAFFSLEDFWVGDQEVVLSGALQLLSNNRYFPFVVSFDKQNGQIRNRRMLPEFPQMLFSSLLKTDSGFVAGGGGADNSFNLIQFNDSLGVDSIYDFRTNYPLLAYYSNTSLYPKPSGRGFYALGRRVSNLSLLNYVPGITPVKVDTFPVADRVWVGNGNFASGENHSFYLAGSKDPLALEGQFKPGESRDIVVYKTDTSGHVLWTSELLGQRYYLTTQIVPAAERLFVFSIKYDWDTYAQSFTDVSVISLDSTGHIISEKEFSTAVNRVSLFPNPAKEKLRIRGVPEKSHLALSFYTLEGKEVKNLNVGLSREVTIGDLWPGIYGYVLSFDDHRVFGKLVKVR